MQLNPRQAEWLVWCVEDDDRLWDTRAQSPLSVEEAVKLVNDLKELASHAA